MSDGPHNWPDWWAMVKGWINGDIPLDSLLMTAVTEFEYYPAAYLSFCFWWR
ncbi:hypothetical protein [Salmonella enterica]|uniref:hypothetical protein n=1 Tax=Salmonella enterica TaxID=28901 RepID=UPI003D31878A